MFVSLQPLQLTISCHHANTAGDVFVVIAFIYDPSLRYAFLRKYK